MKYLRLVQAGYENYSGPIGMYEFRDGVSVEPLNRAERDRLSTAFEFVEFDEIGGEETPAGIAHRLVSKNGHAFTEAVTADRQTDEEKLAENILAAMNYEKPRTIHSRADLEKIAYQRGIAGLREVATVWGVKHRQIGELIELILVAQTEWVENRTARIAQIIENDPTYKPVVEEPKAEVEAEVEAKAEPEDVDQGVLDAAASGDLSAAVNNEG